MKRRFVAYFYFVGFGSLNFGVSVYLPLPNIEIHVPFGFFRIGFVRHYPGAFRIGNRATRARTFGYDGARTC